MIRHIARSGATRSIPTFAATLLVAAGFVMIGALATQGGTGAAGSSSPLGVYVGYQSPDAADSFGQAIGHQPTYAMDFLDGDSWSALVSTAPSYMSAWEGSGYSMIWGIPILPNNTQYSLADGATGAYNSYFLTLAQDMVSSGQGGSIVRLGWEFNGGWFPWAANGRRPPSSATGSRSSTPCGRYRDRTSSSNGTRPQAIRASATWPTTTRATPTSTTSASTSTTRRGPTTRAFLRSGRRI